MTDPATPRRPVAAPMPGPGALGHLELDHLVVAAASLTQGVAWCEATLGVVPAPGGVHTRFGTHNRLLALGGAPFPRAYLEIIAIDPAAPAPAQPRWFGLDEPALQARLHESPRLLHWVARTPRLDHDLAVLRALGHEAGEASRATRGALSWRIALRADGRLLAGGALPTLIQWDGAHPHDTLPASGVALESLQLHGLDDATAAALVRPGIRCERAPGPALCATLSTRAGRVTLTG